MMVEAAGICRGDLGERGEATRVALDGDDMARAFAQEGAGQAARPGADLDDM